MTLYIKKNKRYVSKQFWYIFLNFQRYLSQFLIFFIFSFFKNVEFLKKNFIFKTHKHTEKKECKFFVGLLLL